MATKKPLHSIYFAGDKALVGFVFHVPLNLLQMEDGKVAVQGKIFEAAIQALDKTYLQKGFVVVGHSLAISDTCDYHVSFLLQLPPPKP